MSVHVYVVRVFTADDGSGGNPLGIVAADSVAPPDRQAIATRLGFSETVFVTPTAPVAQMQIFTPATELPFAGHPTVGTAWWLRAGGTAMQALDVPAGRVEVGELDGLTTVRARAEWAPEFVFHDLDSPADVDALDPASFTAEHHYAWAWISRDDGTIRSRMFAPDMGIAEDEATGAAAVRITARLQRDLRITQGRGSTLVTRWDPQGWVRLGGRVVADVPIDL
ncbi:MAG TPA: PhzF family phenazine biosynthesis protein [Aldersonia sp.]